MTPTTLNFGETFDLQVKLVSRFEDHYEQESLKRMVEVASEVFELLITKGTLSVAEARVTCEEMLPFLIMQLVQVKHA